MRSISILFALLPLALSSDLPISVLKGDTPIYLGDVFWPPAMTFLAWTPSAENSPEEWCKRAVDASDDAKFSLDGLKELQMHDYFKTQAYITWNENRFADCVITPESTNLPLCEGGRNYYGPGNRKWTCWVVGSDRKGMVDEGRNLSGHAEMKVRESEERLTDATIKPTLVVGAAISNSIVGAFTASVTAM
jgi:hypothetical protein